jgi:hypothetical protein
MLKERTDFSKGSKPVKLAESILSLDVAKEQA